MTGPWRLLATILLGLFVAAACSGCTTLGTWERSILMSRMMLDPGNPMAHQEAERLLARGHIHVLRGCVQHLPPGGGHLRPGPIDGSRRFRGRHPRGAGRPHQRAYPG